MVEYASYRTRPITDRKTDGHRWPNGLVNWQKKKKIHYCPFLIEKIGSIAFNRKGFFQFLSENRIVFGLYRIKTIPENKNLEKNNGPRRNIVADYHRCNLIILLLENKSHKILFTNGRFWLVGLVGQRMAVCILNSF